MIQTFHINTNLGKYFGNKLPFLTENELKHFNNIGYSGKTLDGRRITRTDYLNSLGKGEFDVTQTKFASSGFKESFTIVWVH